MDAVTGEVLRLLKTLKGEMLRTKHQQALHQKIQANFRERYLTPALSGGFIEMTIPDKPNSQVQKYRLTEKGNLILGKNKK